MYEPLQASHGIYCWNNSESLLLAVAKHSHAQKNSSGKQLIG